MQLKPSTGDLNLGQWLSIIGIHPDGIAGLSGTAAYWLAQAEVLVGSERHLALIPPDHRLRICWRSPLSDTVLDLWQWQDRAVAVLASGDPLWYGVASLILQHIPREQVRILPSLSCFSLMAMRLGWAIADLETLSLCGRPVAALIPFLAPRQKILILSADGHTPTLVAQLLQQQGYGQTRMWVFEHLQAEAETCRPALAQDWQDLCQNLNAIALECVAAPDTPIISRQAGLPDQIYQHDGQITKAEVRAVTLAALAPRPGELLWDVGAGCGSIAIEWCRSHSRNRAIAIEPHRTPYIAANAEFLGATNLQIVEGTAPLALAGLEVPDGIFIGGGITSPGILECCWQALKPLGRIVANVVTLEGEQVLVNWQQKHGGSLRRITIERLQPLGKFHRWKAQAPVTQWVGVKNNLVDH
ncbi:MAG: precorrin-6y C5,15-methyltransferase (decarboxylating) subunit CbiE [Pseudanabaenaceae cyanobacterium bins.68]|nr:precorrin-6y C5,15-methyltransferase (decarboxylating) subunit CbiE [Pseudanabaenaceae cyanobacterium bins.68]